MKLIDERKTLKRRGSPTIEDYRRQSITVYAKKYKKDAGRIKITILKEYARKLKNITTTTTPETCLSK